MIWNTLIAFVYPLLVSSVSISHVESSEYIRLQKLEFKALHGAVGKAYIADFTGREDCNKTRVKYLGVVHTSQGKSYKILTSFFVFRASATCHGTSDIKIYNLKNQYIGEYYVGMPDGLPDMLRNNKLLYLKNSKYCNPYKTISIDMSKGILKRFYVQCSENRGDEYVFSSDN